MLDELLALVADNPMATGLVVVAVLTAGAVGAAIVHDAMEQRQLAALQAKLTALEHERDRLKDHL